MHALRQHPDREGQGQHAAQRCGEPELVVIAAAGIEADDEGGIADARRQMIDIEGQIEAAGFLAGLDQDHGAGMGHALLGQGQDRRQRGEDGIAVIGPAAAVELVARHHRRPGAVALGPAGHLRLLVEMAIEQHGFLRRRRPPAGDLDQDEGRAAGQAHHLERGAGQGRELPLRPARQQGHGLLHMAMLGPIGVEGRGFVRDPDVFGQPGQDFRLPAAVDEARQFVPVHHP